MERRALIQSLFSTSGKGLEIGPSHSPLMPKSEGFDVEILDYLDADKLRQKYAAAGTDVSRVEEVDYIADGRPMTEVIGTTARYQWIIASHVIEHVPDLVLFLRDCAALLRPGGVLVLAVPDKRCCFDTLRPISTVGQVLQAHLDGRTRPPPGILFDDVAYARRRGTDIGWDLHDARPLEAVRPLFDAQQVFETACRSTDYVDVHCWVFVPSSFRLIISALAAMGQTSLRETAFRNGAGEFYAVLSNCGDEDILDFDTQAQAAQAEEREATTAVARDRIRILEAEITSAQDKVQSVEERLAAATARVQAQAAQAEEREATTAVARDRIRILEAEITSAQDKVQSVEERLTAATARVQALENSSSWRVTAPLRSLLSAIRARLIRLGARPL